MASLSVPTPLRLLFEYVNLKRVVKPRIAFGMVGTAHVCVMHLWDGRKFSSPPLSEKKEAEQAAAALCLYHLYGFNKPSPSSLRSSSGSSGNNSSKKRKGKKHKFDDGSVNTGTSANTSSLTPADTSSPTATTTTTTTATITASHTATITAAPSTLSATSTATTPSTNSNDTNNNDTHSRDSNKRKKSRDENCSAHERKREFLKVCEGLFQKEEWKGEKLFRKVDKASIALLPLLKFSGRIRMVDTQEELDNVCELLCDECVLGMDTESRPSFAKGAVFPVTLLQLATEDTAYLINLSAFSGGKGVPVVPPGVCALLSDPKVLKVGAGISEDMQKLLQLQHNDLLHPQGVIDLVSLARRCGIQEFGLRGLCALLLGHKLSKTEQLSRWDKFPLTPRQQHYAACDAWTGYRLYHELVNRDIVALEEAHLERVKRRTEALDQFLVNSNSTTAISDSVCLSAS